MAGKSNALAKVLTVLVLLGGAAGIASAGDPAPAPAVLTSIPTNAGQPCVQVRIGTDQAGTLDCLNAQFRQMADHQNAMSNALAAAPYAVSSPPTQLGLFNEGAVKEQFGDAFGHSAQPQRPH